MTTQEFSTMVQKYQALVYTVCHQLVPDVQEAQDLTQETFLAAWRAIDRCPPGFEKQWLARIAANKAKDYLRSAWVRKMNTPATRCWRWRARRPVCSRSSRCWRRWAKRSLPG